MSTQYKVRNQNELHFVTFSVINWIDVFSRNDYKDIFLDSLKHCQAHKSLELYAYVIMTNHVHMVIGTKGPNRIETIVRDLKKYTSVKIIQAIKTNPTESRREWMVWMFERAGKKNSNNTRYQFWQQDFHPIELSTNNMLEQKIDYIHENPVRAGLVYDAASFVYSSASSYSGRPEKMIDVILAW